MVFFICFKHFCTSFALSTITVICHYALCSVLVILTLLCFVFLNKYVDDNDDACSPVTTSNSHNRLWLGDVAQLFGREFHVNRWKGTTLQLAYQTCIDPYMYACICLLLTYGMSEFFGIWPTCTIITGLVYLFIIDSYTKYMTDKQ